MRKILILLLIILSFLFTNCVTTTEINTTDDGVKYIYSRSNLNENDFEGSNFFLQNIPNTLYKDFNTIIFLWIKDDVAKGRAKDYGILDIMELDFIKEDLSKLNKGEVIYYPDDVRPILYITFDSKIQNYRVYCFDLMIDKLAYDNYEKNVQYYNDCIENIKTCNWIIDNCSSPTLTKSRQIQVPYTYTEAVWVSGDIGARTIKGGYQPIDAGHTEYVERTGYRYETEYYVVDNPYYDLEKVKKAKKNLPIWKQEKTKTEENLRNMPFDLYYWD